MNVKTKGENTGVIYQFEDTFEGHIGWVVVDIAYSGSDDILEFAYASIDGEVNNELTPEQIQDFNKELEHGREEEYVKILAKIYEGTEINFDHNY